MAGVAAREGRGGAVADNPNDRLEEVRRDAPSNTVAALFVPRARKRRAFG